MNELHLFAGAGGGILGGMLLGHRPVCAVEIEPYCRKVLLQRQRDGILPRFPIWDDITTFDGRPWRGRVDVVCGGFPCQDISAAGKGAGIEGERSGLWAEMFRVVCEVGPGFVFVENSPMLTSRGLGRVLGDLASVGYDAEWCVLGADDVGAPHVRKRIWILGHSLRELCGQWGQGRPADAGEGERKPERTVQGADVADPAEPGPLPGAYSGIHCGEETAGAWDEQFKRQGWWSTEPDVGRVAHGVAARVDRLKAIGNGQVPQVAATAFARLMENFNSHNIEEDHK